MFAHATATLQAPQGQQTRGLDGLKNVGGFAVAGVTVVVGLHQMLATIARDVKADLNARLDVSDAVMQRDLAKLENRINSSETNVRRDLAKLETKVDALECKMESKMDGLESKMENKLDALESRMAAKSDLLLCAFFLLGGIQLWQTKK